MAASSSSLEQPDHFGSLPLSQSASCVIVFVSESEGESEAIQAMCCESGTNHSSVTHW